MRIYIKQVDKRVILDIVLTCLKTGQLLASVLPRYPKDLAVIVNKVKGKDITFKDVNVRRQKVHNALLWQFQNNPRYKEVVINQHALDCLPINGVPTGIMTVKSDNDILPDEMASPNSVPSDSDEDKVYN